MKKPPILFALFGILTLLSSCFIFRPQRMQVVGEVPVKTVFGKVFDQFRAAEEEIKKTDLQGHTLTITEADVIFDNVITDELNASLSLLVFKPGYTHTKKRETTVTYSLMSTPNTPAPKDLTSNQAKNPNALRDLIVSAYNQFVAVTIPGDAGHFEKDIEIDVIITVDQNGNFEVTGPIGKFTPDVTLSRDVANTQTVTVKFAIDKK